MNILIIPYPFVVPADTFCGSLAEVAGAGIEGEMAAGRARPFGYFDVHQRWMQAPSGWARPEEPEVSWQEHFVEFVIAVLRAARDHSPIVHAVAFPELALDFKAYTKLRDRLEATQPDVELLIAGVSGKESGWRRANSQPAAETEKDSAREGNFVAVVAFDPSRHSDGRRESVREKHHRWKLDRSQILSYGLTGMLSPELQWWENIPLQSRRVDFSVIRQQSVVAALICEDLARVDPCQQIVRAVAPNLTVALLMDAPQKATRWPARYATVLAEDPGTAVLTITSRGLMARQDRLGIHPGSATNRIVAMWRDDREDTPLELNCPYDAQGLLLSVVEEPAEDISLDGRRDAGALAFRYAGHVPVRITDQDDRTSFASILSESLCID